MKVHRGKKKRRLCVWPKLVLEWVSSLILDLPYLRVTLRIAFIRVIRKARKTQYQNPEFGQTQCEIKKKPSKKYISIQPRGGGEGGRPSEKQPFLCKLSFILSFVFPERLYISYRYFHCSYLYNYYNYSRTLCIKCWVSAFHTEI
jgi:hypothetical protein